MMKKIFTIVVTISVFILNAQEIKDVFRYSQENIKGTARFQAMSGAFGALGGDLSAISINPAAGAVFLNNHGAITFNFENNHNKATFFGTKSTTKDNNFNLSQIGGIGVFTDLRSNKWKSVSFGINYDNTSEFDNEFFAKGTNTNNSIAQYFLNYANGITLDEIENTSFYNTDYTGQQAFLGYEAFIINPIVDVANNTLYSSNVASGTYNQQNSLISKGFNGKMAFNIAGNYDDKLYLGINLNGHFVDFRENQIFTEYNNNPIGAIEENVTKMRFENEIYTYGSGFSMQLGAIYKPTQNVRLGVSLNSPTWYELFDETQQSISSNRTDGTTNVSTASSFVSDVIIYEPYSIRTPWKATGSFAYVFEKKGLISIDYALTDYSFMKVKPVGDFNNLNKAISNIFTTSGELRIGAEYKIKKLSLRGGFRNQQSPYKDKSIMGDLNGFSGGLGYNFQKFKLDFAYTRMERNNNNSFFATGLTDTVMNQNNISNFSLTLSADFN